MLRTFPVPTTLGSGARAWLDGPRSAPVVPRPAATVVLVRPAEAPGDGVEVFLMRRRTTMAFAAGMEVFPGGGVDERDAAAHPSPGAGWAGAPVGQWAQEMGTDEARATALVCAAVRETFEECGVLLASRPGAADVVQATGAPWEADRQRLLARDVALVDLLAARSLVLRADLLRPWAHWTTPGFEPRRYDTWFLLAALPAGQVARHISTEATSARWWPVQEALAASDAGSITLMPPTRVTVEELAAVGDVQALWSTPRVLTEVVPDLVDVGGTVVMQVDLP